MSKLAQSYILLAVSMILIGSFVVANKQIVTDLPVFLASELRLFISCCLLIVFCIYKGERLPHLPRRDWLVFILQAFVGIFLFGLFTLYGLKWTTAVNAGIIMGATPAFMALISWLILRESFPRSKWAAVALTMIGALFINIFSAKTGHVDGNFVFWGNMLVVGAAISEAVFMTFGKLVRTSLSPLLMTTIICTLGALFFLPFGVYEGISLDWSSISFSSWFAVLYIAIAINIFASVAMNRAQKILSGSTSAAFSALMPVSSIVLGGWLLHEEITVVHAIGILFVLAGIVWASKIAHASEKEVACG
ncbi:MAG: DMT family transporter [Bacilli bacterium]